MWRRWERQEKAKEFKEFSFYFSMSPVQLLETQTISIILSFAEFTGSGSQKAAVGVQSTPCVYVFSEKIHRSKTEGNQKSRQDLAERGSAGTSVIPTVICQSDLETICNGDSAECCAISKHVWIRSLFSFTHHFMLWNMDIHNASLLMTLTEVFFW